MAITKIKWVFKLYFKFKHPIQSLAINFFSLSIIIYLLGFTMAFIKSSVIIIIMDFINLDIANIIKASYYFIKIIIIIVKSYFDKVNFITQD